MVTYGKKNIVMLRSVICVKFETLSSGIRAYFRTLGLVGPNFGGELRVLQVSHQLLMKVALVEMVKLYPKIERSCHGRVLVMV